MARTKHGRNTRRFPGLGLLAPTLLLPGLLAALVGATTISCSGPGRDHGVVLWRTGTASPGPGAIVRRQSAEAESRYVVVRDTEGGARVKLPSSWVKFFESYGEARAFQKRYVENIGRFERTVGDSVPVRRRPSRRSEPLTSLERGSHVKTVQAVGAPEEIGGLRGVWHEIVTLSGHRGYVFGGYLEPVSTGIRAQAVRQDLGNPVATRQGDGRTPLALERFLDASWRPAYMHQLIRSRGVDPRRLNPYLGLFPDRGAGRIVINTSGERLEFAANTAKRRWLHVYSFDEGRLWVHLRSERVVDVRYRAGRRVVRERLVKLSAELEHRLEQARERRARAYAALRERLGRRLESDRFGSIVLLQGRIVRWSGRDLLEPNVIPYRAETEARVRFDLLLTESLAERYERAFSLLFELGRRDARRSFVYREEGRAVIIRYVPPEYIQFNVVRAVPASAPPMRFVAENRGVGPR
jgi:hypothetical protein